jgi:2'-5' RNA ligase
MGAEEHGLERLAELERGVRRACVAQGFLADPRPFASHVTVARVERGARGWHPPPGFFSMDCAIPWQPPAVALVESLAPGGPTAYRPVRHFPFA